MKPPKKVSASLREVEDFLVERYRQAISGNPTILRAELCRIVDHPFIRQGMEFDLPLPPGRNLLPLYRGKNSLDSYLDGLLGEKVNLTLGDKTYCGTLCRKDIQNGNYEVLECWTHGEPLQRWAFSVWDVGELEGVSITLHNGRWPSEDV